MELIETSIFAFIFVVGIWWMLFVEYPRYYNDETRQRLFKVRDRLFSKACRGIVDFDQPAYGMTRTTFNGMIEYAHDITFLRFVGLIVSTRFFQNKEPLIQRYEQDWAEAFRSLPNQAAKNAIAEARIKMDIIIFMHLINTSLMLKLIVMPSYLVFRTWQKRRRISRKIVTSDGNVKRSLSTFDAEALRIGTSLRHA